MDSKAFERLRERLLRAGIAPRHVHRYLLELREHHEDACRAEQERGLAVDAARRAAWDRLGSEDDLARSLLERRELYALSARYPSLVLGAGPLALWILATAALVLASRLLAHTLPAALLAEAWVLRCAHVLGLVYLRLLPVALGLWAVRTAVRQRLAPTWSLLGALLVAVLVGSASLHLIAPSAGTTGQLGVSSPVLPFIAPFFEAMGKPDLAALLEGLVRSLLMLGASVTPLLSRRAQHSPSL
jgi:hypothetical protein